MLARLRTLASGAALGVAGAKAAQVLSKTLEDDPDYLHNMLANFREQAPKGERSAAEPPAKRKIVALVKMNGTIAAPTSGLGSSSTINLERFEKQLTSAFKAPSTAAVAIEMNSPGGSPVQSALLFNRLRALKREHPDVPLLCYVTDVCASGGYYIAAAADEIHVLPSSIVGSIGVVSPSIGLAGLLKQHGIEDRTLTAGTSKVGDNPLLPRNPVAVAQKRMLLEELHDDFKAAVTAGRGDKLQHAAAAAYARRAGDRKDRKARAEALFDGSVFAGRTAVSFGLADGLYDELDGALKRRFGDDVKVRELKGRAGLFESLQRLQAEGAEAHATALRREGETLLRTAAALGGGAAGVATPLA